MLSLSFTVSNKLQYDEMLGHGQCGVVRKVSSSYFSICAAASNVNLHRPRGSRIQQSKLPSN